MAVTMWETDVRDLGASHTPHSTCPLASGSFLITSSPPVPTSFAPFQGCGPVSLNPLLPSPRVQLSSRQGLRKKAVDANLLVSCPLRRAGAVEEEQELWLPVPGLGHSPRGPSELRCPHEGICKMRGMTPASQLCSKDPVRLPNKNTNHKQ